MKAQLLSWTFLFVLMLPMIPLFAEAQETNHVAVLAPTQVTVEQGIKELFARIYNELGISADNQLSNTNSKPEVRDAVRKRFLEAIKAKAEKGDAEAQLWLGICYLDLDTWTLRATNS